MSKNSNLRALIDSRPDFAALENEWHVGSYEIYKGSIYPDDPGKPVVSDEDPWEFVRHEDKVRPYYPLQDPNLYSSFVRLGARGEPTEKKIMGWVNEYGLLTRGKGKKGIEDGMLNQAPMPLQEFKAEVMQARSADLLYYDLRQADREGLQKRLIAMRENPNSKTIGPLSQMDRELVDKYANPDRKFGWPQLPMAQKLLESFVEKKIAGVQMSFWNMATETTEASGEWTDFTDEYVPTQSWRFPDLLSAIYLQFYLIMVEAVPLRICEHPRCRTPFPATRTDKRFCTETCRSGARIYT